MIKRSNRQLAAALIVFSFLVFLMCLPSNDFKRRQLQAMAEQKDPQATKRPIVKTFFQPLSDPDSNVIPDDPVLKVWIEEWKIAGFEPQVITMEDAKKHPYYDTMKDVVEKVFKTDRYNQYCFFRYLAMAETGGGWHVDYDTIPANFPIGEAAPLPNGGKFTSFETFVPSLISASEEEWTRVSKLIVEQIPVSRENFKSDMYMLLELYRGGAAYDIDFKEAGSTFVSEPDQVVKKRHVINCEHMNDAFAIHFSHSHIKKLYLLGAHPLDISNQTMAGLPENRRKAIKVIMNDYRDQCKASSISLRD